jgi:hypothetical protein
MGTAEADHSYAGFAAVRLTDAHNRLGRIIDESQRGPVILQKHQRPHAAVVSMHFLEQALDALHGHRQVITPETMTNEQKADLEAGWPSDAELTSDRWND